MSSAKKSFLGRLFKWGLILGIVGTVLVSGLVAAVYFRLAPNLPPIDSLNNVQFQVPLRIYTQDGALISEFGEKRREPARIDDIPDVLKQAFLAAEDDRFYQHPGVDYHGIIRAAINLIRTGQRGQGGSTITMQVARNFFLSNKKTYERKLNEILLALRIESELSKDKILELYLNKIYLGNRAYGVGAAARVYYGKDVTELNLAEAAMIAGLPKAPSRYNPIVNPERAVIRRNYVLRRMAELGYISEKDQQVTTALPVTASLHYSKPEVEAAYVAEMVRSRLQELYGDRIYTAGLSVYTTITTSNQQAANRALRRSLVDYEKRHGFTGPIDHIEMSEFAPVLQMPEADSAETENAAEPSPENSATEAKEGHGNPEVVETLLKKLASYRRHGGLMTALVLEVDKDAAKVLLHDGLRAEIRLTETAWARAREGIDKLGPEVESLEDVLAPGNVVYVEPSVESEVVTLAQLPQVEGALVSISPQTGAILALVGGFDFHRSKFNRVTQARRQPGSNFKPFIYSTALEFGDTAASVYNDAPVVFHDSALEGEWRPENYSGRFFGPTRLREALVKSRNLVSIRVLRRLGFRRTLDYVEKFGFEVDKLPPDLSLALGSGSVTPWQLVTAYSVFANQGFLISPHFIDRIEDSWGKAVFMAPEVVLCDEICEEEKAATKDGQIAAVNVGGMTEESLQVVREEMAERAGDYTEVAVTELSEEDDEKVFEAIDRGVFNAPRVIDARNAFIMNSIMREVVTRGTARKARELKRKDLAGKTGTTNDQHDAWFSGFNSQVATSVWIGYDELQPLGGKETGGRAALPMWIDYMADALKDIPEDRVTQPSGLVTVRIDRQSGELTTGRNADSMFEFFRAEHAPQNIARSGSSSSGRSVGTTRKPRQSKQSNPEDQLF